VFVHYSIKGLWPGVITLAGGTRHGRRDGGALPGLQELLARRDPRSAVWGTRTLTAVRVKVFTKLNSDGRLVAEYRLEQEVAPDTPICNDGASRGGLVDNI